MKIIEVAGETLRGRKIKKKKNREGRKGKWAHG